MELSDRGRKFIEGYETFVGYVYDDARAPVKGAYREWNGVERVKGTLTIGFGHTNAAKHPLKIHHGLRVTREEADEILNVDLHEVIEEVELELAICAQAHDIVAVSQGQFDALVSFNFNCGPKNLRNLLKPLRDHADYKAVGEKFGLYVFTTIGGRRVRSRGLVRRREGEEGLWNDKSVRAPRVPVHHQADVTLEHGSFESRGLATPKQEPTLPKPEVKPYIPFAPEVSVKKRLSSGTFVWLACVIGATSYFVMRYLLQ
jgi:GH24 family phage-related lysozyme (muramidase)